MATVGGGGGEMVMGDQEFQKELVVANIENEENISPDQH